MLTPSLSIAGLSGLPEPDQGPRALIEWAARLGFRAVQLDAAVQGIRPRDLDRSARRDLAALLRRQQLNFSGLDLWIPPTHFIDPANQDRAVTAILAACELASELSRLDSSRSSGGAGLSVILPDNLPDTITQTLAREAERHGVTIADHAWPGTPRTLPLARGIDPAMLLMAGADPASEVSKCAQIPASARLSDADMVTRAAIGAGRLDTLAYQVALITKGYSRDLIVDLRGLKDQPAAAKAALAAINSTT